MWVDYCSYLNVIGLRLSTRIGFSSSNPLRTCKVANPGTRVRRSSSSVTRSLSTSWRTAMVVINFVNEATQLNVSTSYSAELSGRSTRPAEPRKAIPFNKLADGNQPRRNDIFDRCYQRQLMLLPRVYPSCLPLGQHKPSVYGWDPSLYRVLMDVMFKLTKARLPGLSQICASLYIDGRRVTYLNDFCNDNVYICKKKLNKIK